MGTNSGAGSYTQGLLDKLINPALTQPSGGTTTRKRSVLDIPDTTSEKKVTESYWGADGKFYIIYADGTFATSPAPPPPQKATGGGGGVSYSDVGPVSAGLRQQEIDQAAAQQQQNNQLTLQKLRQDDTQFRIQQQYLGEKLRIDTEANNRAEIRATQQLMEQIQTRMESNALAQQRVLADAQQLQAQMDFQAAQANASQKMQAAQFNEQARQANISQQRGVASDIANFSGNPGDVGKNASYLMAGSSAPISKAIATGQDARTDASLMPLDLLLQSRDQLAQGPQQFMPQDIVAPRVPMPTFQPQNAQMPQYPGQAAAQPQGPQIATGTPQQSAASIQGFLGAGKGGGSFSSGGNTFRIDQNGTLVAVPAANGFFGTVDQPTLFMAGEGGSPETVSVTPNRDAGSALSGTMTPSASLMPNPTAGAPISNTMTPSAAQPQPSASRDFLNAAFARALGNSPWAKAGNPTPVGVSAPGTNPFLQEMAAALAAIGQGINPALFMREAQMATPMGVSGAPSRRTR